MFDTCASTHGIAGSDGLSLVFAKVSHTHTHTFTHTHTHTHTFSDGLSLVFAKVCAMGAFMPVSRET